jgi:hypothetical protein
VEFTPKEERKCLIWTDLKLDLWLWVPTWSVSNHWWLGLVEGSKKESLKAHVIRPKHVLGGTEDIAVLSTDWEKGCVPRYVCSKGVLWLECWELPTYLLVKVLVPGGTTGGSPTVHSMAVSFACSGHSGAAGLVRWYWAEDVPSPEGNQNSWTTLPPHQEENWSNHSPAPSCGSGAEGNTGSLARLQQALLARQVDWAQRKALTWKGCSAEGQRECWAVSLCLGQWWGPQAAYPHNATLYS